MKSDLQIFVYSTIHTLESREEKKVGCATLFKCAINDRNKVRDSKEGRHCIMACFTWWQSCDDTLKLSLLFCCHLWLRSPSVCTTGLVINKRTGPSAERVEWIFNIFNSPPPMMAWHHTDDDDDGDRAIFNKLIYLYLHLRMRTAHWHSPIAVRGPSAAAVPHRTQWGYVRFNFNPRKQSTGGFRLCSGLHGRCAGHYTSFLAHLWVLRARTVAQI